MLKLFCNALVSYLKSMVNGLFQYFNQKQNNQNTVEHIY